MPDDRVRIVERARYGYEKKAAYADGRKLVVSSGDNVSVRFSLPEEAEVTLPLDTLSCLSDALPPWPESGDTAATRRDVSDNVIRRLKQLGYR